MTEDIFEENEVITPEASETAEINPEELAEVITQEETPEIIEPEFVPEPEIVVGDTVYYLPGEDGAISCFARWKFDPEALEAPEPIVPGYDGKYYFESQCPEKPLQEIKAEKRAEINTARDAAEQGGFTYMGKSFDSDQIAAQRISMAAQAMPLAPEGTTISWTCQDNSIIDLTAAELQGLVVALAQWSNSCHQKATALKAQIENAQTAAEVAKICWDEE